VIVYLAAGQIDIAVADPTQAGGVMHVEIATSGSSVIASDDGVSIDQISPTVRLSISVKNGAGKSFRVSLAQ
jgi:hyaluronate lyase